MLDSKVDLPETFKVPLTSRVAIGVGVLIPILPSFNIRILLAVPPVLKTISPGAKTSAV